MDVKDELPAIGEPLNGEPDIKALEKEIEENKKRMQFLKLKKIQEKQMQELSGEKPPDSNYITKAVAAQEIITYLKKIRIYIFVIAFLTFISIFAIQFLAIAGIALSMVAFVATIVAIIQMRNSIKYLATQYKLPGYERLNKKTFGGDPQQMSQKLNTFFNT